MKALFVSIILLLSVFARAQISSPAFDPDCYQPSQTDPTETQVRFGRRNGDLLGKGMMNLGPAPFDSNRRLFFSGLPPSVDLLSSVCYSTPFNVNSFEIQGVSNLPADREYQVIGTAHLHRQDRIDLITQEVGGICRVYWADSLGQYDVDRYSTLWGNEGIPRAPYHEFLYSDSVEDLVVAGDGNIPNYGGGAMRILIQRWPRILRKGTKSSSGFHSGD